VAIAVSFFLEDLDYVVVYAFAFLPDIGWLSLSFVR